MSEEADLQTLLTSSLKDIVSSTITPKRRKLWEVVRLTWLRSTVPMTPSVGLRCGPVYQHGFRLVWIYRHTVDIQPMLHCFEAVVQRGSSFSVVKNNIELNVIGVLSMVDNLWGDYLGEWYNVQRKQHWSKNGSPGLTVFAVTDRWLLLTKSDRLLMMCDVQPDPFKGWTSNVKVNLRQRSIVDISKVSNANDRSSCSSMVPDPLFVAR